MPESWVDDKQGRRANQAIGGTILQTACHSKISLTRKQTLGLVISDARSRRGKFHAASVAPGVDFMVAKCGAAPLAVWHGDKIAIGMGVSGLRIASRRSTRPVALRVRICSLCGFALMSRANAGRASTSCKARSNLLRSHDSPPVRGLLTFGMTQVPSSHYLPLIRWID